MKRVTLSLFFAFSALVFLSNQNGALPENTGAPSEQTCGRSQCHNIQPNVGAALMDISYAGGASTYNADSTRLVRVKITNPPSNKNGFQIVALDANNQNVGTWTLAEPTKTKLVNGISLAARRYVTHTLSGVQQKEWTINWKAPSTSAGKVTFHAAVLASNMSGNAAGDQLYTKKLTLDFAAVSSSPEPEILRQVRAFPNPASDFLRVENLPLGEALQLDLLNAKGQTLRQQKLDGQASARLDVADLQPGVYFLKIRAADKAVLRKVLVI